MKQYPKRRIHCNYTAKFNAIVLKKVQLGSKLDSNDCTPRIVPITLKNEHSNAVNFDSES